MTFYLLVKAQPEEVLIIISREIGLRYTRIPDGKGKKHSTALTKVIKRIAYGYLSFRNFRARIIATVNRVCLTAKIAALRRQFYVVLLIIILLIIQACSHKQSSVWYIRSCCYACRYLPDQRVRDPGRTEGRSYRESFCRQHIPLNM